MAKCHGATGGLNLWCLDWHPQVSYLGGDYRLKCCSSLPRLVLLILCHLQICWERGFLCHHAGHWLTYWTVSVSQKQDPSHGWASRGHISIHYPCWRLKNGFTTSSSSPGQCPTLPNNSLLPCSPPIPIQLLPSAQSFSLCVRVGFCIPVLNFLLRMPWRGCSVVVKVVFCEKDECLKKKTDTICP